MLCYVIVSGIDLENIVYYKDDTHYFVMTAKKQSLLEKGVILQVNPVIIVINVLTFHDICSTTGLKLRCSNLD